ncbi:hypothetical protein [Rhodopseudomonas sp. RCAM05734]|uniref:hypothetical protein n=1 Tax=Rhodopseudomonas sp. RCAM05734 TaxID=3457549 RepID=UPI004044E9BC
MARAHADKAPAVRPVRAVLINILGTVEAKITMVVADEMPKVVMLDGNPYLLDAGAAVVTYVQHRPFRADGSF